MKYLLTFFNYGPRRKSGLFYTSRSCAASCSLLAILALVLAMMNLGLSGCGAVAPRFRSGEKKAATSGSENLGASAKKVKDSGDAEDREEKAADADKVLAGTRSFRTEKNAALSNLDQAKMMREISKMMGVSYRLGGEDQSGIDCSAYTMVVYKNSIGKQIPRKSTEQYSIGSPVSNDDLKFGDLVFFNTTGESASHVGIYLGDDLFAHASVALGVTISSLQSPYYKKRFEGGRRVVD